MTDKEKMAAIQEFIEDYDNHGCGEADRFAGGPAYDWMYERLRQLEKDFTDLHRHVGDVNHQIKRYKEVGKEKIAWCKLKPPIDRAMAIVSKRCKETL